MQPTVVEGQRTIQLAGGQSLVITRAERSDTAVQSCDRVELLDARGVASITIRVNAEGATIDLGLGSVRLSVAGDLAIDADRVAIHGRKGLDLSTGASARLSAAENMSIVAKRQSIAATLGSASITANDDVAIDGERIRMNC